ncbi:UxaA family hydrolase [Marinovum sp. 2_MG-2023]|uniref:UxaA family hydrolase n=1 Tax=Roseobacteraceae TaxID=2854170 RepID=UPI00245765A5|nr:MULTISPECIES: UxaA family hydrolase [Roseobacteraceae]MDO6732541.1 UxaA family hydrolase [Marinovum sp. 2_MG-2023]MDO6781827.1 UxaA family hydrolase [Marinovum sp. 1_MG-2023]
MTTKAHMVRPDDMVAYLLADARPGMTVQTASHALTARDAIPVFHKIALLDIAAGATIHRGGWPIGRASTDIPAGAHVHVHNLVSAYATSKETE